MIIEIGAKVFFPGDVDGLEVINISVDEHGVEPLIYFDDGGDMPASLVFEKAEAWA